MKRLCLIILFLLISVPLAFAQFGGSPFSAASHVLTGDLTLENGETISNSTDGRVDINGDLFVDGSIGIGTAPSYPLHIVTTDAPSGNDFALFSDWQAATAENAVQVGVSGYSKNTGSTAEGTGHVIGTLGLTEDTTANQHDLYGVEGRVNALGTEADNKYYGVLGLSTFQHASAYSGYSIGVQGRVEITTDGSTPLVQGNGFAFYAPSIIGGSLKYSFYGVDDIRTDNNLIVGGAADNTTSDYGIIFGNSSDTNLYRSAANTLKTDDSLNVVGYTNHGAYEATKVDFVSHTVTAADVTAGFASESWSVAAEAKIVSLTTTVADASDSDVKATPWVSVLTKFDSPNIIWASGLVENDVLITRIEWIE